MGKIIKPQQGFQQDFLSSSADIVFGGGIAGAGKSYALLLEPTRHIHNKDFGAVFFRRTMPMIKAEGGLADTSNKIYPLFNAKPSNNETRWVFPSGSKVKFAHLQFEKNTLDYQGAQIPLIGFDELTQFTKSMFFYLLSRNRTTCGVRPYMRATMNPQGEGWVKDMIEWYIYPDDYPDPLLAGMPIMERANKIRWFTRLLGKFIWGNTPQEVIKQIPKEFIDDYDKHSIKSFSFIPGRLDDNQMLLQHDPSYRANLLAQDKENVMRLLRGSWKKLSDNEKKLCEYRSIKDSFSNTFVDRGKKYMSCDIAFEGSDSFVIVVWSGWRIEKIYTIDKSKPDEVLRFIKEIAQKHSVPRSHIVYDADGIGAYLRGFLKNAVAFNNNGTPIDIKGHKQLYKNLKTQCEFIMASIINEYGLYINVENEVMIDRITEELYAIERRGTDSKGKLMLNSKAERKVELGRSPDVSDAIMMRSIFTLIKPKGGKRRTSSI